MTTNLNKRQLLREKRKAQKRRSIIISTAIIAGVIALISTAVVLSKLLTKPANYESSQGFTIGDPDAKIEVTAFSNYLCSHCKVFSETAEKEFISDYVDTGKVYYRYVNLANTDPLSINASEASYCAADQNKFFQYKNYLFTYASAKDGFSQENLIKYAKSAGLDTQAFETCLSKGTYKNAYVSDRTYAQSVGIRATPTFLVNGKIVTSSELEPTVNELLGN